MVALRTRNQAKAERAYERELRRHLVESAYEVAKAGDDGELPTKQKITSRRVRCFSQRSRVNLMLRLCELDYAPLLADPTRVPAMLTLTYSGEWLATTPDAATAKAHFQSLCKRYERAWGHYEPCTHHAPAGHVGCGPATQHVDARGESVPCTEHAPKGHTRCTPTTEHWVGEYLACVWKHEFQGRGAPHFHPFMTPPHGTARENSDGGGRRMIGAAKPFPKWLSAVWTDIVFADEAGITRRLADKYGLDGYAARALMLEEKQRHRNAGTGIDYGEGLRSRDPKRLAVYFTKHGMASGKEYQHRVPEAWQEPGKGPGRFWGYRGLTRAVSITEIGQADFTWLSRLLRRYAAAGNDLASVTRLDNPRRVSRLDRSPQTERKTVPRVDRRTGRVRYRTVHRRTKRFHQRSGWLSVNSGPMIAISLLRALRAGGLGSFSPGLTL